MRRGIFCDSANDRLWNAVGILKSKIFAGNDRGPASATVDALAQTFQQLVIPWVRADFAAEHPIRPRSVYKDHGQQKRRSDQKEVCVLANEVAGRLREITLEGQESIAGQKGTGAFS
jgi:hypothetical protein